MKKFIHQFICYTKREVVDVGTRQKEIATYTKVFGFVVKVHYEPVQEDEPSTYLEII